MHGCACRFDLIYLLLDKFDEEKDLRLARHLISLYHPGATSAARPQDSVVRMGAAWACARACACTSMPISLTSLVCRVRTRC